MGPLHYAEKFGPFLSLDYARVEGGGHNPSKERLHPGAIQGKASAIQGKEGIKFFNVAYEGTKFCHLATLFQVATKRNPALRDRITICHCDSSLAENPAFFRHITEAAKFKTFKIPRHVRDIWAEDASGSRESALLVTGDPADMMFGTYVMAQCILDPPNLKQHGGAARSSSPLPPLYMKLEAEWTLFADHMVYKGYLSNEAKEYWVRWITPFVSKCPIKVKTVFDFLWWCSYALKYQHDLNRTFYNNDEHTIPHLAVNRIVNFYGTEDFSQWSYHFHYSKMKSKLVWASYKHALKEFIRGFVDGMSDYYSAKLKVQSVSNNWGFEHGLDSNYNLIRWGKYSISRKKMEQKYPDNVLFRRFVSERRFLTSVFPDGGGGGGSKPRVQLKSTFVNASDARDRRDDRRPDPDLLPWVYYTDFDRDYRRIYYTPSTQSSCPTNYGGSTGDGGADADADGGGDIMGGDFGWDGDAGSGDGGGGGGDGGDGGGDGGE